MLGNKYTFLCVLIRLRALCFTNRKKREKWRSEHMKKMLEKVVLNYKWGVSYSVFDGHELLEASIRSIRKHVDYINVVYQTESWYGAPAANDLLPTLNRLVKIGLIDELIEYKANPKIKAGIQELKKRNIGLHAAQLRGVDYFMTMDTDEFYNGADVYSAKNYIIQHGITHSFCDIAVYGLKPTIRLLVRSSCFAAFFAKIGMHTRLKYNKYIPTLIDPTRQMSHCLFAKYFVLPSVTMHHMTYVRKNICEKFTNSSAKELHNMTKKDVRNYQTTKVLDVFEIETTK